MDGKLLDIDLIEVNGRISASICSVGFDAKVAYSMKKFKRIKLLGGSAAYNASILQSLLQPIGCKMKLNINGKEYKNKLLLACIANGSYYGGGFKSAPLANLQDGLLDIIIVKKVSRFKIASVLSKYKKGDHFSGDDISGDLSDIMSYHRASEIHIETPNRFYINMDGECSPTNVLHAKILPKATTVIVPKQLELALKQKNYTYYQAKDMIHS